MEGCAKAQANQQLLQEPFSMATNTPPSSLCSQYLPRSPPVPVAVSAVMSQADADTPVSKKQGWKSREEPSPPLPPYPQHTAFSGRHTGRLAKATRHSLPQLNPVLYSPQRGHVLCSQVTFS